MTGEVIINPGSGPVAEANEADAIKNMVAFAEDVKAEYDVGVAVGKPKGEEDGRWSFDLTVLDGDRKIEHEVDMPGLPLERVRYLKLPDQNIWNFPRLYVDGSSWVWCYGVHMCEPHVEEDE